MTHSLENSLYRIEKKYSNNEHVHLNVFLLWNMPFEIKKNPILNKSKCNDRL